MQARLIRTDGILNLIMDISQTRWQIVADRVTFENARQDPKFPFVVAIARSANAVTSINSMMLRGGEDVTSRATRDRLNSYLMASALMYEVFKLIRAMNQTFQDDEIFQNGLRKLLRDPTAQQIERNHLNPVRHSAVFHFAAETFAEFIAKSTVNECIFARGEGTKKIDVDYSFGDVVSAEILVGFAEDSEEFYAALGNAMQKTHDLVDIFSRSAERLISFHLKRWRFEKKWLPS